MRLIQFGKAFYIAKKDIKEYYLKPPTISWGILFPLAFALTFIIRSRGDIHELAPGLISLALFFGTTSMASASIVFERRIGAFERLLLYPASYLDIALGKVLSSFLFGTISSIATIFLLIPLLKLKPLSIPLLIASVFSSTFLFASFGVLLAFVSRDPFIAMTIFNSVRFPMIFLSGIFIPLTRLPPPLRAISLLLPLTYSVEAIKYSVIGTCYLINPLIPFSLILILSLLFIFIIKQLIERSIP